MKFLKGVFWTSVIATMMFIAFAALLDCVANTQENIERQRANNCKIGQHVTLYGHGFLKTRHAR